VAEQTPAAGPRIEREVLGALAVAVLVPVFGLIYASTRADTPNAPVPVPVPAPAASSPVAVAVVARDTPAPAREPTPGPVAKSWSEVGIAAVESRPPAAVSSAGTGASGAGTGVSGAASGGPPAGSGVPAAGSDAPVTRPDVTSATSAPRTVDTSNFPPPPARAAAPRANSAGIARVVAPGLLIDHYVEVVGIVNNEMQTPRDASYAIGWYDEYSRPGGGGNVVVSAHETWNRMRGPFFGLHRAAAGDEIAIEMADGRRYRYVVFSNVRYPIDDIPMYEIIWPSKRPPGEEWLTLLTCGGRIVYNARGFGEYLDRDVVIARRVAG